MLGRTRRRTADTRTRFWSHLASLAHSPLTAVNHLRECAGEAGEPAGSHASMNGQRANAVDAMIAHHLQA